MKIIFKSDFESRLNEILDFIAIHSISAATKFHDELYEQIAKIPQMPFRFRKNELVDDENVRDLIFKGYVVVFKVEGEKIIVLTIYKHNLWCYDDLS